MCYRFEISLAEIFETVHRKFREIVESWQNKVLFKKFSSANLYIINILLFNILLLCIYKMPKILAF